MFKDDQYHLQRLTTYDSILSLIDARVNKLSSSLIIVDIRDIPADTISDASARESWTLIAQGLKHLKDGGPSGTPGMITSALTKSSLRSCALASSLGIKAPQFEPLPFEVNYKTGREEALFFATRLIDAVEGDISKSRQLIHQKIMTGNLTGFYGNTSELADPVYKDIAQKIANEHHLKLPVDGNITHRDEIAVRQQMIMSLGDIVKSYTAACTELKADIAQLSAPTPQKPRPKGQDLGF